MEYNYFWKTDLVNLNDHNLTQVIVVLLQTRPGAHNALGVIPMTVAWRQSSPSSSK